MEHQGNALLSLVTQDPATAVDVEKYRRTGRMRAVAVHVELVGLAAIRQVGDVAGDLDVRVAPAKGEDQARPAQRRSLVRPQLLRHPVPVALAEAFGQGGLEHSFGPAGLNGKTDQPGPRKDGNGQADLAGGAVKGAQGDEDASGDDLP